MTTPDVTTLLAEALHREATTMTVTDSHQALRRLERTVRVHRRRRVAAVLTAAAAAVGVLVAGAALVVGDDRADSPPTEKQEQTRELPLPGHRIVYGAGEQVLLVSDQGDKPRKVLDGKEPRFAPGGARVAYVDGSGHLAVAKVAERGPWSSTRLDDPPPARTEEGATGLYGPIWSPDGSRIAYMANSELRVVDVATGKVEALREFRAPYVRPMDWTPDGSALVLGFDRSTTGGEMVVEKFDLATGRLTPFLDGDGETTGVRFSPDGSQIRPVLTFEDPGLFPDSARVVWSPDSTTLVWDVRRAVQVSRLDLATGVNEQLVGGEGRSAGIDWDRP